MANVHRLDLRLLEQQLLAGQDHPDPLLGQALQGRSVVLRSTKVNDIKIELTYLEALRPVAVEVGLGLEGLTHLVDVHLLHMLVLPVGPLLRKLAVRICH